MRGKSAKRIDFTVKRRQILSYAGEITRHQRQIKVKMTDPRTLRGNTKKMTFYGKTVPGIGWVGTSCEHDDKNPDF